MVPGGTATEWGTLLALVLGPGLVATVLWAPVLASSRLRALFRALPPTGSVAPSYGLVGLGLSVPWLVGLGWAFARIGAEARTGTPTGEPVVDVAVQLGLLYVVGLPVAAGAGLPSLGLDWDPEGYATSTWAVLGVAAAWYVAVFAVPAFLFGLVASLPS